MTVGSLDVARIRAETPGCANVAHFNYAGSCLPSQGSLNAVIAHLQREAAVGGMEAAALASDDLAAGRAAAAELLGAGQVEVAFTKSGSEGWGLAFAALPPLKAGDRILVGRHEWGGNLAAMRRAADPAGARIEVIPCREDGSVSPEALASMIDSRVRLVSVTWLPANGGLVNPVSEIGAVTRAANIPYFIDAGQALGQISADVGRIGCDVLAGAGRKYLRGPRGTGLLYVRKGFLDTLDPSYVDVHSAPWVEGGPRLRDDARRFETAENSLALHLGLGTAIRETLGLGVERVRARISALAEGLRARLSDIPGVVVRDLGSERSGLVSFTLDGVGAMEVRRRLAERKINIGANGIPYTPLDMEARGLTEIARASVSHVTDEAEIDRLVEGVAEIARTGA